MTSYVLVPFQACFRLIRRIASAVASLIPPPFQEPSPVVWGETTLSADYINGTRDPRLEELREMLDAERARRANPLVTQAVYPFPSQACSPYRLERGGDAYCTATGRKCSCSTLSQSD